MSSLIFLNTRDGQSTENHNTQWQITRGHLQTMGHHTLSLKNVEFPNTVYPINAYNNIVTFNEGGGNLTATITPNNYTGTQLAATLTTLMTAAGGAYTVTYDTQSKKLTFTETTPTTWYFVDGVTNSALDELGVTTTGAASIAAVHVSDIPINISGTQYVDLITNLGSLNYSSSSRAQILARIPVGVQFGEVVFYEPPTDLYLLIASPQFTTFTLVLRDDKGNPWALPANSYLSLVLKLDPLDPIHERDNHRHDEVDLRGGLIQLRKKPRKY